jgi:hypothetical protein
MSGFPLVHHQFGVLGQCKQSFQHIKQVVHERWRNTVIDHLHESDPMTDCAYLFRQSGSFGFGALPSSEINYGYIGKRLWRIHRHHT